MTPEQQAAYIFGQAVAAMIELESMKAMNLEREIRGESLAYPGESFLALIDKYGISHNAILMFYRG